MFYTADANDHGLKHNPFKAIIAPRPIAWISTLGTDGSANLAPYSFFNGMSDQPMMLGFSSGVRKMGIDEPKDSITNIEATGEFCVNIVSHALIDQMNVSSKHYPHGEDEFEYAGVTKASSKTINAPYVSEAPVAMECELFKIVELAGSSRWVIGLVKAVHIKDEFIVDGKLDVTRYEPVARLGYKDYAKISETFELSRPK